MSEPLHVALQELLGEVVGVSGALVASIDGLVMAAATTPGVESDVVAALAAATNGVGTQFAHVLALGEGTATVIQATEGCAVVHPVNSTVLLVLYSDDSTNVARLHLAVRQAKPKITAALGVPPA